MLKDGINKCTNAEYHANRSYLSSSVLKTIYYNLADYKRKYIDGEMDVIDSKTQSNFDEGSLTHSMILEPNEVQHEYIFYPGLRKAGEEWEKFKAAMTEKKVVISKPQRLRVESYVEGFKRRPEAVEFLKAGEAEQTICGTLFGVPIKVRFDWIDPERGIIADIKTTRAPSGLEMFKDSLRSLNYQLSAALYTAMAEQYYGRKFDFYFLVISKTDMECHVYKTSSATMAEGLHMVRTACKKFLEAKSTGDWTEKDAKIEAVSDYEILEV